MVCIHVVFRCRLMPPPVFSSDRIEPVDDAQTYSCPHCAAEFIAEHDSPQVCSHCGQMIEFSQPDELSWQHIQAAMRARTSGMRVRSYCLVGAAGCAVTSLELVWRFAIHPAARPIQLSYLFVAALMIWFAIHLANKAATIRREMNRNPVSPPTAPPDFSTLSDGSQIVRNLERMK
jgi:ribosomal protein S27AE